MCHMFATIRLNNFITKSIFTFCRFFVSSLPANSFSTFMISKFLMISKLIEDSSIAVRWNPSSSVWTQSIKEVWKYRECDGIFSSRMNRYEYRLWRKYGRYRECDCVFSARMNVLWKIWGLIQKSVINFIIRSLSCTTKEKEKYANTAVE